MAFGLPQSARAAAAGAASEEESGAEQGPLQEAVAVEQSFGVDLMTTLEAGIQAEALEERKRFARIAHLAAGLE
eukprot:4087725-Alexandrium_andersonii.AAC.1